jgi:hypothetical protein
VSWVSVSSGWGPWQIAALTADFTALTLAPQYRLSSDGTLIQFAGSLLCVTGGTLVAFTVPLAYRPKEQKYVTLANSSTGYGQIMRLNVNGDITVFAGAGAGAYLDGITAVLTP